MINQLGRCWQWTPELKDETYFKILKQFEDHNEAVYSIHQIAQVGEKEEKQIGEWYGPNTVAQVLK